ncbi:MAG: DUF934 domain-containing protein [Sandaracinaceae bacterium]
MLRRTATGAEVAEDPFVRLGEDDAVPADGAVLVPFERWSDELAGRDAPVGVIVPGSAEAKDVAPLLDRVPLVAITFPKFTDGRGYSLARSLRERYGFRGELRAVGDVLRDQLFYMARCGFDAFELKEGKDVEDALSAFEDFSVTYQPATDRAEPLWRR